MFILQWLVIIITIIIAVLVGIFNTLFLTKIEGNYFKGPFNTVYFQNDFEGAKFYSKVEGVSSDKFQVISCDSVSYCYGKQDNKLYYNSYYLKGADPMSFRFIDNWWYARDKNSVFYLDDANSKKLEGVNPDEFIKLDGGYWKYRDKYYQYGKETEHPPSFDKK